MEGSPSFLQDFCKKSQWRAKKLRERGSNTARPTEKGGGGRPIGARPADFGASCRHPRRRKRREKTTRSTDTHADTRGDTHADTRGDTHADTRGAENVAKKRLHFCDWVGTRCRRGSQDTKKTRFPMEGIGLGAPAARRRVSSLLLIPRVNTCASVRIVLQGRARRWCIVMPMSDRLHIEHYI